MIAQPLQLFLDAFPALDRPPVYAFASLDDTRRIVRGPFLLEPEAPFFDIEADVIRQFPRRDFLIEYQVLVAHLDRPLPR